MGMQINPVSDVPVFLVVGTKLFPRWVANQPVK
jgi:hypothetical protein